jgi:hypothetical protein
MEERSQSAGLGRRQQEWAQWRRRLRTSTYAEHLPFSSKKQLEMPANLFSPYF